MEKCKSKIFEVKDDVVPALNRLSYISSSFHLSRKVLKIYCCYTKSKKMIESNEENFQDNPVESTNIEHPILHLIWNYRSTLIIILTPIILLPLPLSIPGTVSACIFTFLIVSI